MTSFSQWFANWGPQCSYDPTSAEFVEIWMHNYIISVCSDILVSGCCYCEDVRPSWQYHFDTRLRLSLLGSCLPLPSLVTCFWCSYIICSCMLLFAVLAFRFAASVLLLWATLAAVATSTPEISWNPCAADLDVTKTLAVTAKLSSVRSGFENVWKIRWRLCANSVSLKDLLKLV
jgi:hypothetical protein